MPLFLPTRLSKKVWHAVVYRVKLGLIKEEEAINVKEHLLTNTQLITIKIYAPFNMKMFMRTVQVYNWM